MVIKREKKYVKTGSSVKTKLKYKTKANAIRDEINILKAENKALKQDKIYYSDELKEVTNVSNKIINMTGNGSKNSINSTIHAKNITGINKRSSLKKASIKSIGAIRGMASKSLDNMKNKDLGTGINSTVYMANKIRQTMKIVSRIKKMIGILVKVLSNPIGIKVSLITIVVVFLALLLSIIILLLTSYTQVIYGSLDLVEEGTGIFDWPVPSSKNITSEYGIRIHPITYKQQFHYGVDIGEEDGANIVAADAGKVSLVVESHRSYGNYLTIDHGNGNKTLYAHCSSIDVVEGQNVQKGQIIAKVGRTGTATGSHLHFEVEINGDRVDPLSLFK